jgi:spermidine synthase
MIPSSSSRVSYEHSRIYGLNTLGAVFGILVGAFLLIPICGLRISALLASSVHLFIGIYFFMFPRRGRVLSGTSNADWAASNATPEIPTWALLVGAFLSGALTIGLEVLMIRILNLSVGSEYFVFPIVLATFVLGLGLGSLSIQWKKVTHLSLLMNSLEDQAKTVF